MSVLRRIAVPLSAGAAFALLAIGSPAYAADDDVRVSLRGLPDTMVQMLPATLQVTFSNTTNEAHVISSVISVELDGLPVDAVHLQRLGGGGQPSAQANGNAVFFIDPTAIDLGARAKRQVTYLLTFTAEAPDGRATVTAAAYEGNEEVGSDRARTRVGLGRGRTTKTTPPNTNPGFVPTFAAGPTYSLAPLPVDEAATAANATVPKILYVLGSLLVVMGVVTLFLIFRPSRGWRAAGARAAQVAQGWHPRAAHSDGPQQWPVMSHPDQRRPYDPGGRRRAVRNPGPGENLPPWRRS